MKKKAKHQEILAKRNNLLKAKEEVKKEFVGIHNIIDEIFNNLESWYLFSEAQIRPTIINLWGMTGVGKTSLLKRIFHHLEMNDKCFKFDIGEYCSSSGRLKADFSERLKDHVEKPVILIFDEFQLGRTINEKGEEILKSDLRCIWDLFDSGKFDIINYGYYASILFILLSKLNDCLLNGVKVENGVVVENMDFYKKMFPVEKKPKNENEVSDPEDNEKENENLFFPYKHLWIIKTEWERIFLTAEEVNVKFKQMNGPQILDFVNSTLNKMTSPVTYDFSKSIIFVVGNIDEAFEMTDDIDPDVDADIFYKHSLKITVNDIKVALLKRFRAEQISRLGNNHVLYPAFSRKTFEELISLEIKRLKDKLKERFKINFEFDKSINSLIYSEGVYPVQGARPIFTTINSCLESFIGKIIVDSIENDINVSKILWKKVVDYYVIDFYDSSDNLKMTKKHKINLKLEQLRKSTKDNIQFLTAVHEAGHAVAAVSIFNIVPNIIVSKSAGSGFGFTSIEFPEIDTKKSLEARIATLIAGYCAEKHVFGDEFVSNGTGSDFSRATAVALRMVKAYGMYGAPILTSHPSSDVNWDYSSSNIEELDKKASEVIMEMEKKVVECLNKENLLLLKVSEYLSNHSKMSKKTFLQYVEKYFNGDKNQFKDSKNYYDFKNKLNESLQNCQKIEKSFINVESKEMGKETNGFFVQKKKKV